MDGKKAHEKKFIIISKKWKLKLQTAITPLGIKIKKVDNIRCWWDVEISFTAGDHIKWYNCLEDTLVGS